MTEDIIREQQRKIEQLQKELLASKQQLQLFWNNKDSTAATPAPAATTAVSSLRQLQPCCVLSVSKVLSNERGQSRCHLAGEMELFGSLVYMHLLNRLFPLGSLV